MTASPGGGEGRAEGGPSTDSGDAEIEQTCEEPADASGKDESRLPASRLSGSELLKADRR
jgi:hypothetical protein